MNTEEQADRVFSAVKAFVESRLAVETRALGKRIEVLERALVAALAPLDAKGLAPTEDPQHAQILERRIDALEKSAVKYGGTFDESKVYRIGTFVTFRNKLWIKIDDSVGYSPPGNGWRLAVRQGEDAAQTFVA